MSSRTRPLLASVTVAVIFGFSFLFTKGTLNYLTPFQLLGLRFALAALFMSLLAACRLIEVRIRAADLPELLGIAFWQPVLYFVFETYGVKLTSASESGVVIAMVPVAVAVLSGIFLREKINPAQAGFISAAVAGVVLMTVGAPAGGGLESGSHLAGIALLSGAVLAAGFYSIFSRNAAARHEPEKITFVMMWVGAVVFNAAGLFQSYSSGLLGNYLQAARQLPVVFGLLYLGLLSSVCAFFLTNYALSRLPASRMAVFLNLTPVVSVLAGVIFFQERLGLPQLAGGFLILAGVWGTNHFAGELPEERKEAGEKHAL